MDSLAKLSAVWPEIPAYVAYHSIRYLFKSSGTRGRRCLQAVSALEAESRDEDSCSHG